MRLLFGLLVLLALGACGRDVPTPTEALCPDPDPSTLTYESFGERFMADYCLACHESSLVRSQRNGAPLYHDFDSLLGVFQVMGHIDEQAGFGPAASNTFMPPQRCPSTPGGALDIDCPQPTEQERKDLAIWLACEENRPHSF
jgi:hypothetical protein